MPFRVDAKTLERLEWPELFARLAGHLRTPRARSLVADPGGSGFAESPDTARQWLRETSEARRLIDQSQPPPLDGVPDVEPLLARLARDGSLAGNELLSLADCARACDATRTFLERRAEAAPELADVAASLEDLGALAAAISDSLDGEGEVRDEASPALARARREVRETAGRVQGRIQRCLTEPEIAAALQDRYVTVRSDRYVLPVRADARNRVPGIVHDASASGTTVFVEPQAVVELNNQLRQAELTVERETRRVLAALSRRATADRDALDANLTLLAKLDLAFARGRLSADMDGSEPTLDERGVFRLRQLRHPLLRTDEAVPNDMELGEHFTALVISGPNAGGKTVSMKSLALATLQARAGMHVAAEPGAVVGAVESVVADIGDEQDLHRSLSTFSAHMANLAEIVAQADDRTLALLDEVGVGTDPGEGAALAQAVLESLVDAGARVVTTTHFNLLKEIAEVDERFANASVSFDPETLAPTYRLQLGAPGTSSASSVAARMGMPGRVLERAGALLDREDRKLDRMLAELSASRAALESERQQALRLREEGETARDTYRGKLERLQERREQLFESMRADLDVAFRSAHADVASVIRELQRGGTAQDAAQARAELLTLEERTRASEEQQRERAPQVPRARLDWQHAKPGDTVALPGGRNGSLLTLPDRRGRVSVRAAGVRLELEAEQISPATQTEGRREPPRVHIEPAAANAGDTRIDLRGLRVDDALTQLAKAIDDGLRSGIGQLEILHGVGTGALQQAVRRQLREQPGVSRFEAGPGQRDGTTVAFLG